MSKLEELDIGNGQTTKLGCLVPQSFPTTAKTFEDTKACKVYTLDEIRSTLAEKLQGKRFLFDRRNKFAGKKYIRNQGQYGACNGWSTAGNLSRTREIRGEPYVCLSGADAYSQMNGGQDNGSALSDGLKVVENGIAPESVVPYNKIYSSQISAEAKRLRLQFQGIKPFPVDSEEVFASGVATGFIGIIAVHATNAFNSENSDGINNGGNGPGNHSTIVQDIGMMSDGTLIYDMPNSWDVDWCDGGHTTLTWDKHLRQTVQNHRFWFLVSTIDNPNDEHKPPVAV